MSRTTITFNEGKIITAPLPADMTETGYTRPITGEQDAPYPTSRWVGQALSNGFSLEVIRCKDPNDIEHHFVVEAQPAPGRTRQPALT